MTQNISFICDLQDAFAVKLQIFYVAVTKCLNTRLEVIYPSEKYVIWRLLNSIFPKTSAKCLSESHLSLHQSPLSRILVTYPSATSVHPPEHNAINHAVTQTMRQCQMARGYKEPSDTVKRNAEDVNHSLTCEIPILLIAATTQGFTYRRVD